MGEIKSSIELAMEKTKGLKFSDEDRQRLEEEKEQRAVQVAVSQYLLGGLPLAELTRKRESASESSRRAMLGAIVQGLRLGREEFSRGIEALELWRGSQLRGPLQRGRDLAAQFGQALQKKRRKIKADLWEELARRGVQGSAVEPNVEASPQWETILAGMEKEFLPKLQEWRETILDHAGR
jgi:hypothetical protein